MGENPPSYNVVTVNLPPEAEAAAANCQPGGPGTLPVPLIVPFALSRVSVNMNAHFSGASIVSPRLPTPSAQEISPKTGEDSTEETNSSTTDPSV